MNVGRKALFLVWTVAWVIVLFLALFELGVRAGLVPLSFRMWEVTYQLDNDALFRIRPRSHATIGPYGNRLTGSPRPAESARRALVLGDSFAYGVNVRPEETIAAALEQKLGSGWAVFNLGVPGYGPDQALALLPEWLRRLKPEAVVLVLFPANDFNDLVKNRLYALDAGSRLVRGSDNVLERQMPRLHSLILIDAVLTKWTRKNSRFLGLYHSFFHDHLDWDLLLHPEAELSRQKLALMRGVLRAFRDELARAGVPLVVEVLPSFEAVLRPRDLEARGVPPERRFALEDAAAVICSEEGIPCVNLTPEVTAAGAGAFDVRDRHLSPTGYARAAEAAYAALPAGLGRR